MKMNMYLTGLITGVLVAAALMSVTACADIKKPFKNLPAQPELTQSPPSVNAVTDERPKKIFESRELTEDDLERIAGKSYKPGEGLAQKELRLLTLTYMGYDDETHYGEMIVNESVASEVLEIFEELYDTKFPIEKIKLIDEYDANDDRSMEDNNSSAYNHRFISGTDTLSNHAKGLAIDINPLYNPYIKGNYISPTEGASYVDRNKDVKGMIIKGDACYKAFTERGWTWGGDWKTPKDYQHFEKSL